MLNDNTNVVAIKKLLRRLFVWLFFDLKVISVITGIRAIKERLVKENTWLFIGKINVANEINSDVNIIPRSNHFKAKLTL